MAFDIFNDKGLKRKNIFSEFLIKKDNIIGEGYFGKVYCAYHRETKLLDSIKQIN